MIREILICIYFFIAISNIDSQSNIKTFVINEPKQLIKEIVPFEDIDWSYFEINGGFENEDYSCKIIFSSGEPITIDSIPKTGFINRCLDEFCPEIISYRKDAKQIYVDTPEKLSSFIGYLDNVEETIIYLQTQKLEYSIYKYEANSNASHINYIESDDYYIFESYFHPYSEQYSSIIDKLEVTEKDKDMVHIRISRKTKEIKIE